MNFPAWPSRVASKSIDRCRRLFDPVAFDRAIIEKRYTALFGRRPNLDQPRLYTEKLLWLNLNYRHPLLPKLVDKLAVREYITRMIGPKFLNLLYAVYDDANDVRFDNLPPQFVLKVNSGSGWNCFCRGRESFDEEQARAQLAVWMKERYYDRYREWPYKTLTSCIVAERLMVDPQFPDRSPSDFKFSCFNGNAKFVSVCNDRRGDQRQNYFNCEDWSPVEFTFGTKPPSDTPIERPADFDQMLSIVEKLASDFPFVRVDMYRYQDQIIFGEMTFLPFAGYVPVSPHSADEMLGDWITLPAEHLRESLRQAA